MRRRKALSLGAASVLPLALVVGCPSDDGANGGSGGDSGVAASGGESGASGSAGAGGEAWDPVWHETAPKNWTSYPPDNLPDCGPGCRVALNLPLRNPATFGHSFSDKWFISSTNKALGFTQVGDQNTFVIPLDPGTPQRSSVYGDHTSYVRSFGIADGQVEIASLITGETKIAHRYTPEEAGTNSVSRTMLGPRHVFWVFNGGIWSRHLETGAVKRLTGDCFSYCASDSALLCEDGRILSIDPDSGDAKPVDYGGAWQMQAACSPARTQYVWIDYRDPPGPGSAMFKRSGGEVYVYDIATKKTRRVTFDSPNAPRGKVYPAVDGNLVVWNEPGDSQPANPDSLSELKGVSTSIAKFDMKTGQRCRLTSREMYIRYKSLHGSHIYGSWFDNASVETWLVDLDLDHPALQWDCVPTPEWKP